MGMPIKVSEILSLAKKGMTLEAQEKIIELRDAYVELQDENLTLKTENRDLKQQLEIKKKIRFDGAVYWLEEGDNSEGPFCSRCYDTSCGKLLIRLHILSNNCWLCNNCEKIFDQDPSPEPFGPQFYE